MTSAATSAAPEPRQAGRLSLSQYLGYAGGDVANNLTFSLASMFLLLYYTDVVGIAAGAAGTVLFVVRVAGLHRHHRRPDG
jgi:glucuronide carrier protein